MTEPASPSIAFVGWNPFQFLHFASLAAACPNATLVVEERKFAGKNVVIDSLAPTSAQVMRCNRDQMRNLDGRFDVIICQTPFTGIEEIQQTKIAMLQYGYAKEAHNFGAWRSFADLCLTFGDYATRKISPFSPCHATGNPRYENWDNPSFHDTARAKYLHAMDPDKKTILYAPTSAPLSSYDQFSTAIQALADEYNVILKLHHSTLLEGGHTNHSGESKFSKICDVRDDLIDLLAISDLVISDFSGAIFDAVYCRIPLILLDPVGNEFSMSPKSDMHSIERVRRAELGVVVSCQSELAEAVRKALKSQSTNAALDVLRDDLFRDSKDAVPRAKSAIHALAAGGYAPNQSQSYIRNEMRALYRCRKELASARTFAGFARTTADRIQSWLQG